MKPIFISYRRDDGIDSAQLLQMHLINMFGEEAVFLDTNTMKPGEEFPVELHKAVINSKIVIAMIGKNWKGSDPQINRLSQENDWVRKELEIALADEKKKIFPVFIKGATRINSFKDLPSSFERLPRFNYAELREKEFKQDLLPLVPLIEPYLQLEDPLKDLPLDADRYKYPSGSPFKGLDYFTEEDAKLFFGRGVEIRKLYNKIKNRSILFLFGQSGSGKSSVLFAGLKPRMEYQGWKIKYFRRETGTNLAEKLNEYVFNATDKPKQLVILDQVEEIFTNPNSDISPEAEAQQLLSGVRNASEKIHVLLSFRKEYLAEIKKLFTGLTVEEIYLEPLNTKGVLESIRGITISDEARDNYELKFADEDVPMSIAQSVMSDEDSHVAPLLQVLLSKMWAKVENKKPRVFSKELLEEVKSHNLISLLNDQISAISEKYELEVESGLVLDILYFFTTLRGTSASHSKDEVINNYNNPDILKIITELKNKYLLSEPKQEDADVNMIRLAHDSLAPLIRELFGKSASCGQRATRLLESKRGDIESDYEVEFSKPDLVTIDAGKEGMRKWTEKEKVVIGKSRQRIQQYELELEEKNKQLEDALKDAREKTKKAQASAMAAKAREVAQRDITLSLRLAQASCKMTSEPLSECETALRDIVSNNSNFCKSIFVHPDSAFEHIIVTTGLSFSPDGKFLLIGAEQNQSIIWNIDGIIQQRVKNSSTLSGIFSPDGKLILTAGFDKKATLRTFEGTFQQSFEGHEDYIRCVAFSPDCKFILTGSNDKTARLWDIDGNKKQLYLHDNPVSSVAFSFDGENVLTSDDKTVHLWGIDGTKKQSFPHDNIVTLSAFSPDGEFVLTGSENALRLWNLDGTPKLSFEGNPKWINAIAFSPDGKSILTGSSDKAELYSADGKLVESYEGYQQGIQSVAFLQDNKYLLTADIDGIVRLWLIEGRLNRPSDEKYGNFGLYARSPDRKYFAAASGKIAELQDAEGKQLQTFEGHTEKINAITFTPDGNFILTASDDKTARLWCLDGVTKKIFEGHEGGITSAAISFDGNYILTGSNDNTARIWKIDGSPQLIFREEYQSITSVAFSPDGNHILTGAWDGTVRLWSLNSDIQQIFPGHTSIVFRVTFSGNGKFILTCSLDGTARLWTLDGRLKQIFKHENTGVIWAGFSRDEKRIVTQDLHGRTWQWRPFWEILSPENTYVPDAAQMKEYGIPEDMVWGEIF